MKAPKVSTVDVSIIIPTFNEGDWLRQTVESILKAKTWLEYEIVIVDDGCDDGSVASVTGKERIRIVATGGKQLGLIRGKIIGAEAARGEYLCFLDSHVLVHDHWIDFLRETCNAFPLGAFISGNLPDVADQQQSNAGHRQMRAYILQNRLLDTAWWKYGTGCFDKPYFQPLSPGGLMFTTRTHYDHLGGFAPTLRIWGAEDIELSLRNYYMGGDSVVDHRVFVYHYYKSPAKRLRVALLAQVIFNCLYVASVYFPHEYYMTVRRSLLRIQWILPPVIAEIDSGQHQQLVANLRSRFVRGFDEWTAQFPQESSPFLADVKSHMTTNSATRLAGLVESLQEILFRKSRRPPLN